MELIEKLKIDHLSKSFSTKKSTVKIIDSVDLTVYNNEFLVILGPGHCGKSVLLNTIAGIEEKDEGQLYLDGEALNGSDARVSMVFQRWSLLPWMSVIDNVAFGLKLRGMKKAERYAVAKELIKLVGLEGFENSFPKQLSGGMKQRVGIARAYAVNPELLLMDEPFGALDAQTRISMEIEIERIWKERKTTVVFVTNNIEEALYLGDRIVLLSECPAKVKKVYDVPFSRPRDVLSDEFIALRKEITDNTDLTL